MSSSAGIILCGGESKRMGRPKAWLPIGNELMLPRIVRLLAEAVSPIVVVAAPEQDLPELPTEAFVTRDEEKGRGPLQGLAAGLSALQARADVAFVCSCDVPLLRPAFVRRMMELLGEHQMCVPFVAGRHHPLSAVYRVEVLSAVQTLLAQQRLRLTGLMDIVSARLVMASELADIDPKLESLRNVNTPEEYEEVLRE